MNKSGDCYKCKYYPCAKTEAIHKFIRENELGVRITLNGCNKFKIIYE